MSAWKFAKGLYLIPFLMAYSALMALDGPVIDVVIAVVTGCVALASSAVAIEGFLLRRVMVVERLGLILAALLVMIAPEWTDLFQAVLSLGVHHYWFVFAGTVLGVVLLAMHVVSHRVAQRSDGGEEPAPAEVGARAD